MMGKLVVWRGKDVSEKSTRIGTALGGFVPIDQLDSGDDAKPRSKSPGKPFGKRSPKIFLQKRKQSLPDQELFDPPVVQATVKPISRHIPLFANIPGYEQATNYDRQAGYDIKRAPSGPTKPPPSPIRPQTADATVGRRRSKTAPSQPSFEPPDSLADKPLPLVLDAGRKRSLPRESTDAGDRPKTSSSASKPSELAGKRNQSDTNLSRRPSGPAYSLTPSTEGKRASQASKATTSSSTKPHHRTSSTTSTRSTATIIKAKSPTKPRTSTDRTILDEVEGTLSATITELQELNAHWEGHTPPLPEIHPALRDQVKPSPPLSSSTPQSTPDNFSPGTVQSSAVAAPQIQRSSQSLPPTPLVSSRPSSATALQSAHDAHRRLNAENEALRTHLSVVLKRFAESDAVRLERDKFERELKAARAKCAELAITAEAAENRLHAVERRLEEANVQKVDVLEENGELRERVGGLLKDVRRLEGQAGALSDENKADLPAIVADLTFRLDDAEKVGIEREARIKELEQAQQKVVNDCQLGAAKIAELTQMLDGKAKEARAAQSERDKFEQLLLAEFRRTAIEVHARSHPSEPLLSQKMNVEAEVKEIRAKAEKNLRDLNGKPDYEGTAYSGDDMEIRVRDLEKEVDYYLKDIVLYKLDVKGYKKDLRKSQNKIRELEQWAKEKGFPSVDNKASTGLPSTGLPSTGLPSTGLPSTPPQTKPTRQPQAKVLRQVQPPIEFQYPVQQQQPQQQQQHLLLQQKDDEIREMEQRPSISSQSTDSTAPPLSIGSTAGEGSPETPRAEVGIAVAFPVPKKGGESIKTYRPTGSPVRRPAGGLGMF